MCLFIYLFIIGVVVLVASRIYRRIVCSVTGKSHRYGKWKSALFDQQRTCEDCGYTDETSV